MIPLFIPSKDRACQLELLLRSIEKNCYIFSPHLVFESSNSLYKAGYDKLWEIETEFWYENYNQVFPLIKEFENFLLKCIEIKEDIFGIATDDCVVFKKFNYDADFVKNQFKDEDLWCFSLRLGLNCTVQDYSTGRLQPELSYYEEVEDCIKWNFKSCNVHDNFGYCGGQDFCLYRVDDILSILNRHKFSSMRELEGRLSTEFRDGILREWMMSPKLSCAVNIPANNMQEPFIANGFNSYAPSILNEKFLNGEVIDLEKIENADVKGCHQPIRYEFIKR